MVKQRTSFSQTIRAATAALFFVALVGCTKEQRLLKQPVIEVNGNELSAKEFSDRLALRMRQFDALALKNKEQVARVKDDISRDFIIEVLTAEWARKHQISAEKDELEQEINDIRKKYPDDFSLRRMLSQENVSFDEWEKSLSRLLLKKKVTKSLMEKLERPTQPELMEYYNSHKEEFFAPEKIHLRQIVLAKENDAEQILTKLKQGGNFKELAKQYSIAPERDSEGDIGWIERGVLEVFDQMFKLKVGARSDIVKSDFGFHIIEVLGKDSSKTLSFDEAKAKIQEHLMAVKGHKAYDSWLEEQIRGAKVLKNEKLIQALTVETRSSP